MVSCMFDAGGGLLDAVLVGLIVLLHMCRGVSHGGELLDGAGVDHLHHRQLLRAVLLQAPWVRIVGHTCTPDAEAVYILQLGTYDGCLRSHIQQNHIHDPQPYKRVYYSTASLHQGFCLSCFCHLVRRHLPALWFAGLANQLFWWTYAKAMWRSFTAACCCGSISFKATAKVGV